MAKVLTKAATVVCADAPGGQLALANAAMDFFKVAGNAVLADTLEDATIGAGCGRPPNLTACTKANAQTAGFSTVLSVNGKPALLDTSAGTTDQGSAWSVSIVGPSPLAGQDVLTAA